MRLERNNLSIANVGERKGGWFSSDRPKRKENERGIIKKVVRKMGKNFPPTGQNPTKRGKKPTGDKDHLQGNVWPTIR